MIKPTPTQVDHDLHGLTARQAMAKFRTALKRLGDLTIEEIDRDLARVEGADYFEQLVLQTKWKMELERWSTVLGSREQYETPEGRRELGVDGSDVDGRLERYKKQLAADFERRVKSDVDLLGITSPVGKIFLMEWHFAGAGEECGARPVPQKQVTRKGREIRIDFMVESTDSKKKLGIELDRNDFDEESQQQAARDRQRERTLVGHGYSLFRFTALEILRDPRTCIREVIDAVKPTSVDGPQA